MTDDRISTLFHDATAEIDTDVPELVQSGIARGRIERRHRNAATAIAALAVVGVVGLGVSIAPTLGPDDPTALQPAGSAGSANPAGSAGSTATKPAASKPTASKPTTASKPKPTGPMGGAVADIPVKAADLPGLFTKLYPGKVTPAEKRTGRIIDNGREAQIAHFLWNGFTTSVGFMAYAGSPVQRCRELQQGTDVTCTQRPDGTVLLTDRDKSPARDGGGTAVGASLLTDDGYEIFALSYNTARKEGPVLAHEPPLSIAQLTHAVTSTIWFSQPRR